MLVFNGKRGILERDFGRGGEYCVKCTLERADYTQTQHLVSQDYLHSNTAVLLQQTCNSKKSTDQAKASVMKLKRVEINSLER